LGALPAACITCIQAAVTACGTECEAVLNCSADKCGEETTSDGQRACVSACCLSEATAAVSIANGQATLGMAQMVQRMGCAAMCGAGAADAGL
jgi:hypothetical protein